MHGERREHHAVVVAGGGGSGEQAELALPVAGVGIGVGHRQAGRGEGGWYPVVALHGRGDAPTTGDRTPGGEARHPGQVVEGDPRHLANQAPTTAVVAVVGREPHQGAVQVEVVDHGGHRVVDLGDRAVGEGQLAAVVVQPLGAHPAVVGAVGLELQAEQVGESVVAVGVVGIDGAVGGVVERGVGLRRVERGVGVRERDHQQEGSSRVPSGQHVEGAVAYPRCGVGVGWERIGRGGTAGHLEAPVGQSTLRQPVVVVVVPVPARRVARVRGEVLGHLEVVEAVGGAHGREVHLAHERRLVAGVAQHGGHRGGARDQGPVGAGGHPVVETAGQEGGAGRYAGGGAAVAGVEDDAVGREPVQGGRAHR